MTRQSPREPSESETLSDPPRRGSRFRGILVLGVLIPTVLVTSAVMAHRPLLVGLAHLFRVDNPAPSDAIVILLGGTPHRPDKAAQLFHKGIAPRILLCRERPDPVFHQDGSRLIKEYLVALGVPSQAVHSLPEEVTST